MGIESHTTPPTSRLVSIDALRGFDMFWIIGGDILFKSFFQWTGWPVEATVRTQLEHVEWEGFHFYDLIFPLFLFLVGVVLPFSLGSLRERGASRRALYARIFKRAIFLFALGLLCNNILKFDWANTRYAGVLQRIALCYLFAALIVMHTRVVGQVLATVVLLAGYWALLLYVAPPGGVPGDYRKETNLAGWVDRTYLPGKILKPYYGFGDNEGILSTIPAIATALLGALAGQWLRTDRPATAKTIGLAAAGAACLAGGLIWGQWFPVIKNLWTSSFVLLTAGWSLLLLALFYGVIDGMGYKRWAFFFVVIGANAITIYVGKNFIDFRRMAEFFFGGFYVYAGTFEATLRVLALLTVEWLFLLWLYRHRLFLRV